MWFRRAYFNLHQIVKHLSFKEGWAAGCWFVPIISLFRPFQIMKELYEETKKYILENNKKSQITLNTNFLGIWWALWIISDILFKISKFVSKIDEEPTVMYYVISSLLVAALCIVTLKIIKDYSKAEKLLIAEE